MRAVYFEQFGVTAQVESVSDPACPSDGAVIKVEASGLCRSDWHGWMGHDPDIALPHVPGHEFAGTIAAIGSDIGATWSIGDRVTVPFICACGACGECQSHNEQVCERQFQPGFTAWGSFAEYVAIRFAEHNLIRLPDSVGFVTAASLGCRFATSFRAIVDQGRVRPGEWVAIHGCGGVGLSAIQIARAMDANVVAIDIDDAKLQEARHLGATHVLNATHHADVPAAVHDLTSGGAHLSVDALGHPTTMANSVLSLRRRGRHVQVGLLLAEQAHPAVPMDRVIAWELELYGSHGMQAHRYQAMLDMVQSGRLRPDRLVGRTISLEQAGQALAEMDKFSGTGMTVIDRF